VLLGQFAWDDRPQEGMMKKLLVALTAVVLAAAAPQTGESHSLSAQQARAGLQHVHGHVNSIDGTRLTFHADDGRVLFVDASGVNASVRRALGPNERVTLIGIPGPNRNQFRARFIQDDSPGRGTARGNDAGWQRIPGTVQAVHGSTVALRADDGRILTVDTTEVTKSIGRALTPGERVEVIGPVNRDRNHVSARWIEQDRARPASARSASQPEAAVRVDERNWQRIHGTVQSVRGSTLILRADDGRRLTVDVAGMSPNVVRGLTPGEGVTVVGHDKDDRRHVSAHRVEPDSSTTMARSDSNSP
jgi:hypothetical protein